MGLLKGVYMPAVANAKMIILGQAIFTDAKGHKMAAVIDIDELKAGDSFGFIPSSEQWLYKKRSS